MITREQRDELARLAQAVFGHENIGQVLIGPQGITVYLVRGGQPLLSIVHPERGLEAAIAAMRILAAEPAAAAAANEPVKCVHAWEETSRDLGMTIEDERRYYRCAKCGEETSLEGKFDNFEEWLAKESAT